MLVLTSRVLGVRVLAQAGRAKAGQLFGTCEDLTDATDLDIANFLSNTIGMWFLHAAQALLVFVGSSLQRGLLLFSAAVGGQAFSWVWCSTTSTTVLSRERRTPT